jgi:AraC family transcriptional regulator
MKGISADELASRMPVDWGLHYDPPKIVGLSTGVSACLLEGLPGEVSNPASDNHILSFAIRGEQRHRQWHDGRLVMNGCLPRNAVNIVPAGVVPRAVITTGVRVLHVYIPQDHLAAMADSMDLLPGSRTVEVIDPQFAPDRELSGLLATLRTAFNPIEPTGRLWREALCQAISARVLQRWSDVGQAVRTPVPAKGPVLASWQVNRILDRFASDLAAEPSLAELAADVGLSTFHFARAFKASTGLPPHQQLLALRLEKARELLEMSDLTVTEISAEVGYSDPGYLARLFRKHVGATPAAYRRERQA